MPAARKDERHEARAEKARSTLSEPTKINFRHRRIAQLEDITDLVSILFPGNRNQQHAAAQILMALKAADGPMSSLGTLQNRHGISRRTLHRTRAKLTRYGLIDHVTWMNSRHGGRTGWVLSGRMSAALRQFAGKIDEWRKDERPERVAKDGQLAALLLADT